MAVKFYQRCYGNYNGWKEFNVSENFPLEALKELNERQVQHSSIPSNYIDELGNVLCLYEVVSNKDYTYVLSTKYNVLAGNKLTNGRDGNYSQAIVFHTEDVIENPNLYLGISEKHFPTDFQYSEDAIAKTSVIPSSLEYEMCFDIYEALRIAGLTEENFRLLIKFIVSEKMIRKVKKPVYIQYDGSKKQMKALIYCILYGLPYFVRKNISISSSFVDDNSFSDIIFSVRASEKVHYFIPETGQNTCEERLMRTITRSKFLECICTENVSLGQINNYYKELDQMIRKLGGSNYTSRELLIVLKLYFWTIEINDISLLSNQEINDLIVDLLEVHKYGNETLDAVLKILLKEIVQRNELLLPVAEERLNGCLLLTKDEQLKQIALEYQVNQMLKQPLEKAIHQLDALSSDIFYLYIDLLNKDEKGMNLIVPYYQYCIREKVNDFNDVSKYIDEIMYLKCNDALFSELKEKCTNIMQNLLHDNLEANLDVYTEKMLKLCNDYELDGYIERLKQYYWDNFSLDMFDYEKIEEYRLMSTRHVQVEKVEVTYELLEKCISSKSSDEFMKNFIKVINRYSDRLEQSHIQEIVYTLNRKMQFEKKEYFNKLSIWLELLSDCKSYSDRKLVYTIYEMLSQNSFKYHKKQLILFKQKFEMNDIARCIVKRVNELVYKHYCEIDSNELMVPLDNWLLIAKPKYENAFEILDDINPSFMEMDEVDIVESSECLRGIDNEYRLDAEVYEKSKSKYSKTVKKYRSLISKMNKVKKNQNNENDIEKKESSGLSKLFSRFIK